MAGQGNDDPAGLPDALDILVVEDDPVLREALRAQVQAQRWRARVAADGHEALARCAERRPDLVLLDVTLPGGPSGIEVCAALRATYRPPPGVIMVTARDREVDVLIGLEVGADDYVAKPFRSREIVARIRAVARRIGGRTAADSHSAGPGSADEILVRGALRIDTGSWRASVGDQDLPLTPTEFLILSHLARCPDRVYSRGQLLDATSDTPHQGYERTIDSHVTRVRRKLEDAGLDPSPIVTVHGIGYRFSLPRPGKAIKD